MQITGGKFKGQRLITPPSKYHEIRPLRSRIRKALFDILGNNLEGYKVLDLFSGTGALGIEALSRGADFVLFVDINPLSLDIIRRNLEKLGLKEKAKIIKAKLPEDITKISRVSKATYKKFQLVFITPPYARGLSFKTLERLQASLLEKGAIVVVEEKRGIPFPQRISNFFLEKSRFYGETALHFYIYDPKD